MSGLTIDSDALLDALLAHASDTCNCDGSFHDKKGRKRCVCMAAHDCICQMQERIKTLEASNRCYTARH